MNIPYFMENQRKTKTHTAKQQSFISNGVGNAFRLFYFQFSLKKIGCCCLEQCQYYQCLCGMEWNNIYSLSVFPMDLSYTSEWNLSYTSSYSMNIHDMRTENNHMAKATHKKCNQFEYTQNSCQATLSSSAVRYTYSRLHAQCSQIYFLVISCGMIFIMRLHHANKGIFFTNFPIHQRSFSHFPTSSFLTIPDMPSSPHFIRIRRNGNIKLMPCYAFQLACVAVSAGNAPDKLEPYKNSGGKHVQKKAKN